MKFELFFYIQDCHPKSLHRFMLLQEANENTCSFVPSLELSNGTKIICHISLAMILQALGTGKEPRYILCLGGFIPLQFAQV
jgi:hypothetical protein